MVRLVEEAIEVRVAQASDPQRTDEGGQCRGVPDQFLWRGRLYRVTEVVDHWQERHDWWREVAERPLGEVPLAREVWRVAASPGRTGVPGVYDLGVDGPGAGGSGGPGRPAGDERVVHWLMLRTQD